MAILCSDYDLLFTNVPRTGGAFVAQVLTSRLGGQVLTPVFSSYRQMTLADAPATRVFIVREPVDWYRAYWAHARSSVVHPASWPIWDDGESRPPTASLDGWCGHRTFPGFVRQVMRRFPDGFLRALYCDFLNGATHVLRFEQLPVDLESLLAQVGYEQPAVVRELHGGATPENPWAARAVLGRGLEAQLREVESLDGLDFPFVTSSPARPGE